LPVGKTFPMPLCPQKFHVDSPTKKAERQRERGGYERQEELQGKTKIH